jgi:hypothetical protein
VNSAIVHGPVLKECCSKRLQLTCDELIHADSRSSNPHRVSATVIAAAQACGLHDKIMSLPQMYKTILCPFPVTPVMQKGNEVSCTERTTQAQTSEQRQSPGVDKEDDCHWPKCQEGTDLEASSERPRSKAELTQSVGPRMLLDLPCPHVPDAAERELLAIARENYLILRAQKRIRRVNSVWNTKYAQRPLGVVPDFSAAHAAALEQRMYNKLRGIQCGITVPEKFKAQRAQKATAVAWMDKQQQHKQYINKVLQLRNGIAHLPHGSKIDDCERVRLFVCISSP